MTSRDQIQRAAIRAAVVPALDAGIAELPSGITIDEWLRDIDLSTPPARDVPVRNCLLCSGYFKPVSALDRVCGKCREGYGRKAS